MKKFFLCFAVGLLFLIASCGDVTVNAPDTSDSGDSASDKPDTSDSGETVTDEDKVDTDPAGDTEPGGDTTPDNPDSDNSDTTPEPKPDDDADSGDSQPDNDADTDTGVVEPTEEEKCVAAGGTYNADGKCTREAECDEKPANTEWNGESSITQTFDFANGSWSPELPYSEYSEEAGTCRFKCEENYLWGLGNEYYEHCVSYEEICEMNDGATWNASQNKCTRTVNCNASLKPENTVWNGESSYTQTFNFADWSWSPAEQSPEYSETAGECHYKCEEGYLWRGGSSKCKSYAEVCEMNDGATWNASQNKCTRTVNCSNKPEHTVWNGESSTTQTFNFADLSWSPAYVSTSPVYSEEAGVCHYKCAEGYLWGLGNEYYEHCVSYAEICEINDATWNASQNKCTKTVNCNASLKPENTVWNGESYVTQTFNFADLSWSEVTLPSPAYSEEAGLCHYKCAEDSSRIGSECLPICSASTTTFPCHDPETGFIWSAKALNEMAWQGADESGNVIYPANSYCEELEEGGFADWHLPNIDELKTLLIADRVTNNCQVSDATGCLSESSCWSCSTCTQEGIQSASGIYCDDWASSYNDGRYSKLGDTRFFWSSSRSDLRNHAWHVYFGGGDLSSSGYTVYNSFNVRCVRHDGSQLAACTFAGGTLSGDTCTRVCSGKPEHSEWNGDTSYALTYADGAYSGGIAAEYSETQGTCHFKCAEGYDWTGTTCGTKEQECTGAGGTYNADGTCTKACNIYSGHFVWNDDGANGTFTQTWDENMWKPAFIWAIYNETPGECHYVCEQGYDYALSQARCLLPQEICANAGKVWTGSECLYECSETSATPCYDSSTGYIWSALQDYMEWADAKAHCEELTEGGFDDWHMANITELRTLIQNCDSNMHSGTCGVVDTPSLSCLSKNSCAADCNACPSEAHSKFGETQPLMSSSKNDESDRPWSIFFNTSAAIGDLYFSGDGWQFRCVRNDGSKLAACTSENGTLSGDTCTRQCSGKPANSEWNGSTSYALTYSGGAYIGGVAPEYSETQGTCHFKCADGYIWTGSQCLPECSETSATPCYDSSTGYIWSEAFSARGWQNALNYCTNLNGNNYGGYSAGWHLPNINELRTLVQNCAKTQLPPQTGEESCAITYPDHLSYSGDWTDVCQGCTYDANNPGKYSKLGDTESFWSSSIRSDDSNFAWYMDFLEGYLYGLTISESNYVRCVRKINQ